jgi:predicted lipoprotein
VKLTSLLVATALLAGLAACSDGGDDGAGTTATATGSPAAAPDLPTVVDDLIVPRYDAFLAEAGELEASIDALCAQPAAAPLDAAREQWTATREAWRQTVAFGVGPTMTLRTPSAVDFAASEAKVQEVLDAPEPITAEAVADLGANARGLGVVELLLFGQGSDALTTADGARRCTYAAETAALVTEAADAVAAAWAEGSTDRADFLADEGMARDELYNQLIATLQSVADKRLKVAVGYDDVAPNPEAADTGPADRGLDDMVAELDGALASYDAILAADLEATSQETADRTRAGLVEGRDVLVALPRPLTAAVESDLPAAQSALVALQDSKRALATEVASLLGLTLTFSESDGDA